MEALLISADAGEAETNTSRYRILTPAKYLQQAGHAILLQKNAGWERDFGGQLVPMDRGISYSNIPEVVLIERNIQPDWVEKMRLSGVKRIIVTFDDNYGEMPNHAAGKVWWDKYHERFKKALGMVDLVIVPSMALVDAYRPYAKNIQYVANYIDDDIWAGVKIWESKKKIIGWGGSAEHIESWKQPELGNALKKVLAEHPDWKLFMYGGAVPAILGLLPRGIEVHYGPWVSHLRWPETMSKFGIGIAPLHGRYDRYRSNLKAVEYGMGAVPWVASFSDPYTRVEVMGGQVIQPGDWYKTLSLLIEGDGDRNIYSAIGNRWAQRYRMSNNVPVYEKILWPEHKSENYLEAN